VDLLQRNARKTQSEIARDVGLSQPAVADRIRKLEERGVVQGYVARVDASELGIDITAFIGVGIEHPRGRRSHRDRRPTSSSCTPTCPTTGTPGTSTRSTGTPAPI